MPGFLLTPRWLAGYAAVVAAVSAFVLLGWWQLESFREPGGRPATANTMTANTMTANTAAVPIAEVTAPGRRLEPGDVGRTVRVTGRYDARHQLLVPGRVLDGREGYLVLTPLRTDGGAAVAVRRGWVAGRDDPALDVPPARVTVTGVLAAAETDRGTGADPSRRLPDGQVPLVALSELAVAWPYSPGDIVDGFVALTAQDPPAAVAPAPVPATPATEAGVGRWRNLSYAAQWWLFAGATVAFWASAVRTAARAAQNEAVSGAGSART